MVLCRPQLGDTSPASTQLGSGLEGGPIFLSRRKPSPLAQRLIEELSGDGEHQALDRDRLTA